MFKEKSLGLVLVQRLTLLTAQEIQGVKGSQAQFFDILEVVSVDSAMLSSVLKLNRSSLTVPVWMWACEILIKISLIINQQLNEVAFTWHPTVLKTSKWRFSLTVGSFARSMKKTHKY